MTAPYVRAGKVNWIAKGSDVGVQERTLGPGDSIPWHYHTVITDTRYCIEGRVQIEMLGRPERVLLAPGQSHSIPDHRPREYTACVGEPCCFCRERGVG